MAHRKPRSTTHPRTSRPERRRAAPRAAEPIFPVGGLSAFGSPIVWALVLPLLAGALMVTTAFRVGRRRKSVG